LAEFIFLYTLLLFLSRRFIKKAYIIIKLITNKKILKSYLFKLSITYIPSIRDKFNKEMKEKQKEIYLDFTKHFDKKTYKLPEQS